MSENQQNQNEVVVNPGNAVNIWGSVTEKRARNVNRSRIGVRDKHGMFARIPIICKAKACPFFDTCWIPEQDLQFGERCPIEIATILERYEGYCEELGIDPEKDLVDAGLVKDVIDLEIMMLRADGTLARDAALIKDVVAGVTPKGQEIYRPELNPAVELKEKIRKERTRILNQLNATRKDRKSQEIGANDPSNYMAQLTEKARRLQIEGKVIDAIPEEPEKAVVETKKGEA